MTKMCVSERPILYAPARGVECEPPHFLVRATFCTLSRLTHLKMLVLQVFIFKCFLLCRLKTFFKNPATL